MTKQKLIKELEDRLFEAEVTLEFFEKKEESDMGSRTPFLANRKIKIAEILTNEELKNLKRPITYWSEIYPELTSIFNQIKKTKK